MIEAYQPAVVSEEIDGFRYTSTKFPAMNALRLMARTVSLLGEAGLQAIVLSRGKALAKIFPRLVLAAQPALYQAAVAMAYGLKDDLALPRDLCANLKVSRVRGLGEKGGNVAEHFDTHFSGELPHMVRVLLFVLIHNYAGFTLGSLSMGGSPTSEPTSEETPSPSPSQSEESSPETSPA